MENQLFKTLELTIGQGLILSALLALLFLIPVFVYEWIYKKPKVVTIHNLETSTEQEVFDHIAVHLLTQGQKCEVPGKCVYRNGKFTCAAGCLIPEEDYKKSMEGKGWDLLISDENISKDHSDFINLFQRLHDVYTPDDWWDQLVTLAINRGLNTCAIRKFQPKI